MNDRDTSKYLINYNKKYNLEDIQKYVKFLSNSKLDYFYSIHKKNNEHIGNLRLGPIQQKTNTIRFGMMIGNKKNWGKGIGSQVMEFTINQCFKKNNFDKIILSVSDKNKAAIKLYEKFKFKIDKRYKIKKIGKIELNSSKVYDATNKVVLPGIIDTQVHFREPGSTDAEDLESGSRAAVLGGVTALFEMPTYSFF